MEVTPSGDFVKLQDLMYKTTKWFSSELILDENVEIFLIKNSNYGYKIQERNSRLNMRVYHGCNNFSASLNQVKEDVTRIFKIRQYYL